MCVAKIAKIPKLVNFTEFRDFIAFVGLRQITRLPQALFLFPVVNFQLGVKVFIGVIA